MDTSMKNKSYLKPKTLAELLPAIRSILNEDAVRCLTAKKQPQKTIAQTGTVERPYKPMTLAEMRPVIDPLLNSPKSNVKPTRKKTWNSSVKPEKTKSVISNLQTNHRSVRKVLNFQPNTKPVTNAKSTMTSLETPRLPKPELKAKKSLNIQAKNSVRISGVYKMPQVRQNFPATPLSNLSFRSNSDDSFLQNEKNIKELEEKAKTITEKPMSTIAEATPPISTPLKEYRNVEEYFKNTCALDNTLNNHTITNFDEESLSKEYSKREESVIVSLCDMLNKATVMSTEKKTVDVTIMDNITDKINIESKRLLEIEKQTENNIKTIDMGIKMLINIKEAQQVSLENVRQLMNANKNINKDNELNSKLSHLKIEIPVKHQPSYKIPRKDMRKRVSRKSLTNMSIDMETPIKNTEKTLDIYMKMKKNMNFLETPLKKCQPKTQNTPSVTSRNLQKQLDKLYNGN